MTGDIEISSYLFHCPDYLQERMNLLNAVRCIDANVLDLNIAQLIEILLYGKKIIEANWMPLLNTQFRLKHLMQNFFDALQMSWF